MTSQEFWQDTQAANLVVQKLKSLKNISEPWHRHESRVKEIKEFFQISEGEGEEFLSTIASDLEQLSQDLQRLEFYTLFSGEFDRNNAIVNINAGAGGTESCDWASMLFRMYTRWAQAHGYKVNWIEETLGEEGLRRAIVVVATSDEPALKRRQAAYMTMAISEYLRDQDLEVLCLMDSVTRFAMAQREIGLAAGEPPTTKGYTPTVFTELPKLLERAGPGPIRPDGSTAAPITALFTVLVDGDDHNEPIADATRGILDGHIVMERAIAERGRFPAINVLKSISRTMPGCQYDHERMIVKGARQVMAAYANMEELIRIGAYRAGADPIVDRAIRLNPAIEEFLSQDKDEATSLDDSFGHLGSILESDHA